MKQLIKELIYRVIYVLITLSIIIGFIILNIACQIEYMWYVYIMDSECIDFCWFENINQNILGQDNNKCSPYNLFSNYEHHSAKMEISHSIAHNHELFLTHVSVFISHTSQLNLKFSILALLAWYPCSTIILFQSVAFWLPAMLRINVLKLIAIIHVFFFVLWVNQISLPTGILFYKEFQMEPNDSELFASGHYNIMLENMAQIYFVWLFGLIFFFALFPFCIKKALLH